MQSLEVRCFLATILCHFKTACNNYNFSYNSTSYSIRETIKIYLCELLLLVIKLFVFDLSMFF